MNSKKWYKRKRVWLLLVLVLLFIVVRLEWAKFRYDPIALQQTIQTQTQLSTQFKSKEEDGQRIHYLKVGDRPSLPLIVMIHGSPGALNAYNIFFLNQRLSSNADLIAIDRMGFGYSDFGTAEGSLEMQAKMIAKVLADFPNQKKILVGHSMGGPVIARLAMDFPKLVDGLVMVAPSICPELEPSNTWRKVLDFPLIRWFTPSSLRVCNQEIIPLKKELDVMMPMWKNIKAPVTVIQGTGDQLVPQGNADFAEKMLTQSAKVKINKIQAGNHFILWSELDLIVDDLLEIINFLKTEKTN